MPICKPPEVWAFPLCASHTLRYDSQPLNSPHPHYLLLEYTMGAGIVHVTDSSFEADVLKAEQPVLVDFWAAWCGPCKMIAPLLDQLAIEFGDRVKICKMDVDANKDTPAKFNIRGIPTLMIFKNGALESTKVGALSKNDLTAFIQSAL